MRENGTQKRFTKKIPITHHDASHIMHHAGQGTGTVAEGIQVDKLQADEQERRHDYIHQKTKGCTSPSFC